PIPRRTVRCTVESRNVPLSELFYRVAIGQSNIPSDSPTKVKRTGIKARSRYLILIAFIMAHRTVGYSLWTV
ncbi:hypothetical protein, partial [Streptococcus anginosus]|uniref:hypothetical protein n=1 Tax=Streptococcus anginosus TaxID=1328 RepID=UPI002EDA9471